MGWAGLYRVACALAKRSWSTCATTSASLANCAPYSCCARRAEGRPYTVDATGGERGVRASELAGDYGEDLELGAVGAAELAGGDQGANLDRARPSSSADRQLGDLELG